MRPTGPRRRHSGIPRSLSSGRPSAGPGGAAFPYKGGRKTIFRLTSAAACAIAIIAPPAKAQVPFHLQECFADLGYKAGDFPAAEKAAAEVMDLTPRGIRTHLDLNKPIYARTSSYGHFGRTPDAEGGFSWEKTDLADALKRAV